MKRIPIYGQTGVVAHTRVDDEDYDRFAGRRWNRALRGYVVSTTQPKVLLHRAIMGMSPGDGLVVDHRDGDPLNNLRSNLRAVTVAENAANRRGAQRSAGRTSPYRGVSWNKKRGAWIAQAKIQGKAYYLGGFDDELAAARAAADFRREHMPTSEMDISTTLFRRPLERAA